MSTTRFGIKFLCSMTGATGVGLYANDPWQTAGLVLIVIALIWSTP